MFDPVILTAIWHMFSTFVIPFVAFGVGVYISDALGLNAEQKRRNVYLMAIPVGLLTVGVLLSGTAVQLDNGVTKHGHMQSVGIYLIFCGTIMFYGTLVPQLFRAHQAKIQQGLTKQNPDEKD